MSAMQLSSSKMSSIAVVVVALVVITILAGGGYYLYSLSRKDQPHVKESTFDRFTDEIVRKHLTAQANQQQQRLSSSLSGQTTTTTIEIDAKDAKKLMSHTSTKDGDRLVSNVIVISNTYYIKDPRDNSWWMQTMTAELNDETIGSQLFDPQKYIDQLMTVSNTSSYAKQDEEPCGPLRCFKYIVREDGIAASTIWFDTKDFLLRKSEKLIGERVNTTTYSYDAIAITVPSPNKPVPSGKSIFDYFTAPGSQGNGPSRQMTSEERRQFEEIQQKLQAEERTTGDAEE